ncbi:MAG: leucine-rich repeat protein [Clostridia bacterium]|nr:leucine-rich repeat protein [Clostridia bacterium]
MKQLNLVSNGGFYFEKTFSIFLLICIFFSGLVCTPVNAETAVKEGNCGAEVTWHYDGIDTLTIKGTGPMYDCSTKVKPWQEYIDLITEVVIGEGITRIGNQNFMGAKNLKTLTLPATVTSVGKYATYKTSLDTVYYSGSEEAFSLITTDSYNEPFNNSTVNYK